MIRAVPRKIREEEPLEDLELLGEVHSRVTDLGLNPSIESSSPSLRYISITILIQSHTPTLIKISSFTARRIIIDVLC